MLKLNDFIKLNLAIIFFIAAPQNLLAQSKSVQKHRYSYLMLQMNSNEEVIISGCNYVNPQVPGLGTNCQAITTVPKQDLENFLDGLTDIPGSQKTIAYMMAGGALVLSTVAVAAGLSILVFGTAFATMLAIPDFMYAAYALTAAGFAYGGYVIYKLTSGTYQSVKKKMTQRNAKPNQYEEAQLLQSVLKDLDSGESVRVDRNFEILDLLAPLPAMP